MNIMNKFITTYLLILFPWAVSLRVKITKTRKIEIKLDFNRMILYFLKQYFLSTFPAENTPNITPFSISNSRLAVLPIIFLFSINREMCYFFCLLLFQ